MSSNGFLSFTGSPRNQLALGLVLVLLVILYAVRLDEAPVGAVTDDAYYVEMARSLAEGLGPVINTGPDAPAHDPEIFPFGFPLLLSPLTIFFPHALSALKVIPMLGTLLLLPLSWWLPGPAVDKRLRLAVVAVVVCNPWIVSWSGRILSDIPYAALSLGALLLFSKLQEGKGPVSWWGRLALVALCVLAVSVRTIGWAAVLAMSFILLSQRRWWPALILPVMVAAILDLATRIVGAESGLVSHGYTSQMFNHGGIPAIRFALENLLGYVAKLPVILVPLFGNPVASLMRRLQMDMLYPALAFLVGTALLLLAGLAVKRGWRQGPANVRLRVLTCYLVIYGGALALFDGYPTGVQTRLLIPVLPILTWLVLTGLQELFGRQRPLVPRLVLGVMLVAALGHNGWRVVRPLRNTVEANGHGLVDPGQGAAWFEHNADPSAIVMAQEPLVRHIHFQRPVVGLAGGQPVDLARIMAEFDPSFLFIGPEVHGKPRQLAPRGRALLDLARSQPGIFAAVHEDSAASIHIFRIRKP